MKKLVLILLAVSLLFVSVAGCAGSNVTPGAGTAVPEPEPTPAPEPDIEDIDDWSAIGDEDVDIVLPGEGEDPDFDKIAEYLSISGIVVSVEKVDNLTRIEIEDMDGNPAFLVINEETVFPFGTDFAVGDEVSGWYLSKAPMIMIWPAEYTVDVLVSRMGDDRNIKVDRFFAADISADRYFISQDEMFMFNMDENTEIILADGQDFSDGDIEGRRIAVIYGASTRSIPEQATAEKLIVLFEGIMPLG